MKKMPDTDSWLIPGVDFFFFFFISGSNEDYALLFHLIRDEQICLAIRVILSRPHPHTTSEDENLPVSLILCLSDNSNSQ